VLEVRPALPEELDSAGDLVADVYATEGWSPHEEYTAELRDARTRAQHADVLVGVLDGAVVGTVTLVLGGGRYAENHESGDAVIRMLATAPEARGTGVATALMEESLRRAREAGASVVRLATQPEMHAAHRLYERLGFVRTPERDFTPVPELSLLTYALPIAWCGLCGEPGTHDACAAKLELEPPRYCTQCRRRMVVQVHPTGWSARCVEHGTLEG
jgi:ribosomal protein S18 acetylase RimI-like enzyme